jgi:phage-related protein
MLYLTMVWTVETLDQTVDKELEDLPTDMRARFVWISQLIEIHGLQNVREPYIKHVEDVLWEIRMKGKHGISRALYVTVKPKRVVVLRVFVKKTQKTPRREIKLALKRAQEIEQ